LNDGIRGTDLESEVGKTEFKNNEEDEDSVVFKN
jgi:hypothetical protein